MIQAGINDDRRRFMALMAKSLATVATGTIAGCATDTFHPDALEGKVMTQSTSESGSSKLQQAWNKYHAVIEEMRTKQENTPRFKEREQHRAKSYHALMETQAMAYNFAVAPRMHHPRMQVQTCWQTDFYTLGQNCPDFYYAMSFLDGRNTYRLKIRVGAIRLILIQMFNDLMGQPDAKTTGTWDVSSFKPAADGDYEIIVSAQRHEGNWIPLDPEKRYQQLFIRRIMADWNDDPGQLSIELISEIPEGFYDEDEFGDAATARRIVMAADWVKYMVEVWNIGLYDMYLKNAEVKNKLTLLPGVMTSQVGSPLSNYAMGVFDLKDDEALIVELAKIPDSAYWSLQLGDVWSRSLEFLHYQTSINMKHASIDADGAFRAVICRQDPGVANWLSTCGREEGCIVFRNYRTEEMPVPTSTKIKVSEIAKFLPAGTKKISAAERAQQLASRRAGFHKLLGE